MNDHGVNIPQKTDSKRIVAVALVFAIVLIVLFIVGLIPRLRNRAALTAVAKETVNAAPVVATVKPQPPPPVTELTLPGSAMAMQETIVSARAGGYVKRWLTDIGAKVNQGDLLAEIETPEIDQQVAQSKQETVGAQEESAQTERELEQAKAQLERTRATLEQAKANAELARVTYTRTKQLFDSGDLPKQRVDEMKAALDVRLAEVAAGEAAVRESQSTINAREAALKVRKATIDARQSNAQRLQELQSFRMVTAPYSGIITQRSVDVGSLVTAGGAGSTGAPAGQGLFRIAQIETIRVFVNVPQSNLSSVAPGQEVRVLVNDAAQQEFTGKVIRTTQALDPIARTLPVEIHVENKEGKLLPGMYVQVKFKLAPAPPNVVTIPASAMVSRGQGTQACVVAEDGSVRFVSIVVGRDFGDRLEILSGLTPETPVVVNPTDTLRDGVKVTAIAQN